MIYFHAPYFFLLLVLVPLTWLKKNKSASKSNHPKTMEAIPFIVAGGSLDTISEPISIKYRNIFINTLRTLTIFFLVIALARPQKGEFSTEEETNARDLLITLDTSGSMKALDFEINNERTSRLNALKHVVDQFINDRKGDRMGLIVFGSEVFTQCPLTLDHDLLRQYVQTLEIGMAGDSTALGDALALSIKRLRDLPSKSKAVVLITDGLKNAGQIEPRQAAEIAKRLGVRVYTIGIGGNAPAPFPIEDMFGQTSIILREVPLDEETLKNIAVETGGKYFNAKNTEELFNVYKEIDKLEMRTEQKPKLVSEEEFFMPFIIAGLIFLIITEMLARTVFRVIS